MKVAAKELKVGDVISVRALGTSTITGIEEKAFTYNPTNLKGKKNLDVLYETSKI